MQTPITCKLEGLDSKQQLERWLQFLNETAKKTKSNGRSYIVQQGETTFVTQDERKGKMSLRDIFSTTQKLSQQLQEKTLSVDVSGLYILKERIIARYYSGTAGKILAFLEKFLPCLRFVHWTKAYKNWRDTERGVSNHVDISQKKLSISQIRAIREYLRMQGRPISQKNLKSAKTFAEQHQLVLNSLYHYWQSLPLYDATFFPNLSAKKEVLEKRSSLFREEKMVPDLFFPLYEEVVREEMTKFLYRLPPKERYSVHVEQLPLQLQVLGRELLRTTLGQNILAKKDQIFLRIPGIELSPFGLDFLMNCTKEGKSVVWIIDEESKGGSLRKNMKYVLEKIEPLHGIQLGVISEDDAEFLVDLLIQRGKEHKNFPKEIVFLEPPSETLKGRILHRAFSNRFYTQWKGVLMDPTMYALHGERIADQILGYLAVQGIFPDQRDDIDSLKESLEKYWESLPHPLFSKPSQQESEKTLWKEEEMIPEALKEVYCSTVEKKIKDLFQNSSLWQFLHFSPSSMGKNAELFQKKYEAEFKNRINTGEMNIYVDKNLQGKSHCFSDEAISLLTNRENPPSVHLWVGAQLHDELFANMMRLAPVCESIILQKCSFPNQLVLLESLLTSSSLKKMELRQQNWTPTEKERLKECLKKFVDKNITVFVGAQTFGTFFS